MAEAAQEFLSQPDEMTLVDVRDQLWSMSQRLPESIDLIMLDCKDLFDAVDANIPRHDAAEATLRHLGYTYEGGEQWKPPLGEKPKWLDECGLSPAEHAEIARDAARYRRLRENWIDCEELSLHGRLAAVDAVVDAAMQS
jgi:hypothetical protein